MKILVTGAAGFIGSHLVEKLLHHQHEVLGIDNFNDYYDPKIKESNLRQALDYSTFTLVRDDILNADALQTIFTDGGFEAVIHLAAKTGVRPSITDPLSYYKNNIEGTLHLLEFCKRSGIKKFIFASSSSVYGNNEKVPFAEDDNVDHPISPYAASKKAAELICYNYHHLYDIDVYALRFFTAYGPRQRPDMAIHKFTRLILEDKPVPVFAEGKLKRDFTFIDDIVDGIINALRVVKGFEVINLGESKAISVIELIQVIERHLGKKADIKMLPAQPGDVNETFADITKAKRLINYKPKVDINNGIPRFIQWYLDQQRSNTLRIPSPDVRDKLKRGYD